MNVNSIIASVALITGLASIAAAQTPPAPYEPNTVVPAFEVAVPARFRGGTLEPSAAETVPGAQVVQPRTETASISSERLAQTQNLADRLVAASRTAFFRGLMDLTSYATHLDVARHARMTAAELQSDRDIATRALQQEIAYLDEAASRLREFNQPASEGWAADVVMASLLRQRARFHQRLLAGSDRSRAASEAASIQSVAQRYFELRLGDYQVGRASPLQMVTAARYLDESPADSLDTLDAAPFRLRSSDAIQSRLNTVLSTRVPDSIVLRTTSAPPESELTAARQVQSLLIETATFHDSQDGLINANQLASQLFSSQLTNYESGTASLNDALNTYWLMQSSSAGREVPASIQTDQEQRLQSIGRIADVTRDPRGRNTADVLMYRTLASLPKTPASLQPQMTVPRPEDGTDTAPVKAKRTPPE